MGLIGRGMGWFFGLEDAGISDRGESVLRGAPLAPDRSRSAKNTKPVLSLILIMCASALKAQDAAKAVPAPKYSTLLGEDLSGSGFHFTVGGKRYLACSLHQFEGKAPSIMGSMEFDGQVKVNGRVYAGKDIQVLSYVSAELDKQEPLKFDPKVTPAVGDKVYCYDFEESYAGVIVSIAPDQRNYTVKLSKPYPAGGSSGSPIVSAVSGTVVGVLLTANDAEAATVVGFELLKPQAKAEQPAAGKRESRLEPKPEGKQKVPPEPEERSR